jgi:hypothetical protein
MTVEELRRALEPFDPACPVVLESDIAWFPGHGLFQVSYRIVAGHGMLVIQLPCRERSRDIVLEGGTQ